MIFDCFWAAAMLLLLTPRAEDTLLFAVDAILINRLAKPFLPNVEKFLQEIFKKGLTNVNACGIIIKHSGNTEYIKYRGMEQLGSSSGS